MRNQAQPNVFDPAYLDQLARRDFDSLTLAEAASAGPWHVRRAGDRWTVTQDPVDEPFAALEFRETAYALAAVLPILGRERLYLLGQHEGPGWELRTIAGDRGLTSVGHLGQVDEDVPRRLDTVEYLLRMPASLAHLLAAAPPETLRRAGAHLVCALQAS